mgnify:FL=1
MNKVLISGANGFIGRKLCLRLLSSERKFIKIVRNILDEDIADQYLCNFEEDEVSDELFEGVDTVFHLAGLAEDANNNLRSDSLYYKVNVDATEKFAINAAKKGVKRFIFISSVKACGNRPLNRSLNKCINEEDQFEPDGIYGKSKREAEIKLLELGNKSKMHVTIIRPSLVYGKGMKGNLNKMLIGIKKGWFPPLPEVGNRRSMVHVDDLVEIILMVEKNEKSFGEILIATDGNMYSSNEIYKEMSLFIDKPVKSWVVPNIFFIFLAKFGNLVNVIFPFPFNSHRYQKLLGDECYSSIKLESMLGFKASQNIFTFSQSKHD